MTANLSLYPLKFEPILKEKVWGGDKLQTLFNKNGGDNIGESWELSGVSGDVSVISNGSFSGNSLSWLLEEFKEKLVGERIYSKFGNTFPLLFKFIDARETLSVQVHPDDRLAKERHNSFGKTEMWYIMEAEKEASLILGFKEKITPEEYSRLLSEKKLHTVLNHTLVQRGDAFILTPGTVHAIGAGIVLAEIQQTSDITYRIYDWDRPDKNGELRELHTEEALSAINFESQSPRIEYEEKMNVPVQIGKTNYFAVQKLSLSKPIEKKLDFSDSFKVYMCVEGKLTLVSEGVEVPMETGETVLIPATLENVKFNTHSATLLEVYIP
ncbi:MAG: mannose-6-phosphate isomerase [Bacteroidetes bacterium]|jgi:mannose-6-phosphate isomerase|nr:mannose-6-phosphate isomerase [Bacteroidota bacterium]